MIFEGVNILTYFFTRTHPVVLLGRKKQPPFYIDDKSDTTLCIIMHSLSKYDVSEETKMWSQNKWGASWRSTWWENFAFWFLLFSENVGLRRQRVTERTQNTKRDLSSFRLKPQSFHKISRRRKVRFVKLAVKKWCGRRKTQSAKKTREKYVWNTWQNVWNVKRDTKQVVNLLKVLRKKKTLIIKKNQTQVRGKEVENVKRVTYKAEGDHRVSGSHALHRQRQTFPQSDKIYQLSDFRTKCYF